MSLNTNEKLAQLRDEMQLEGVQAYYVPTSDPHMSEYNAEHFIGRQWLTGFTGSAGAALVTQDEALLCTDGRYFIQAEKELAGSDFKLMKQSTPGYPTVMEYLIDNLSENDTLAFNGEIVNQKQVENFAQQLEPHGIKLDVRQQLLAKNWTDRPAIPDTPTFLLGEEWTGRTTVDKIAGLRENLDKKKADVTVIGRLDDVAWLYNIRGGDIESNPVVHAYALVSQEEAILFIDMAKVSPEDKASLEADGVTLAAYDAVFEAVSKLYGKTIQLDKSGVNSLVYSYIPKNAKVLDERDWTTWEKSIKNDTEIKNQREAYRKDGLAFTKLIHWVKTHEDLTTLDELDIDRKAREFREEVDTFIDLSFGTIAAYGPNAAMAHYSATEDDKAQIGDHGFLLVDAGGQYWEGTTDTTRTMAIGELTEEEIRDYTLTLKSHVSLARAIFLEGATGYQLDMLAREPLWRNHIDFKHGTGHGIGYLLNVHEGPQSISSGKSNLTPMSVGMITSNEPGVYREGKHGIRIESVVVTIEDAVVGSDRFLKFETITRVPLEREAIDLSLLTEDEIAWINAYHEAVYADLKGDLSKEEADWLADVCKPL